MFQIVAGGVLESLLSPGAAASVFFQVSRIVASDRMLFWVVFHPGFRNVRPDLPGGCLDVREREGESEIELGTSIGYSCSRDRGMGNGIRNTVKLNRLLV